MSDGLPVNQTTIAAQNGIFSMQSDATNTHLCPEEVYSIGNTGHEASLAHAVTDTKQPLDTEKKVPKEPKTPASKPKGKGSRSKKHARLAGASDQEISSMSGKDKKQAQIVVPTRIRRWSEEEKALVVDYIVKVENWDRVKMNLKDLCVEVSYRCILSSYHSECP